MATFFLNLSCVYAFVGLLLVTENINVSSSECGTTQFSRGLISRGTDTDRGEYPFLAAVYLVEEFSFICGGSLIAVKHVLTAAHCMNQKNKRMKRTPDDVIVLLGAYDLTSRFEKGIVQREVAAIHIHPDWRVYSEKYDADLAILVLSDNVSFTNYIRPVCIPSDDSVIIGAMGSVVGWGLTENGTQPHVKYPKQAITTALNDSYCYTTDYNLAIISSQRTFCGRGDVGSPNRGDSGGGFFVRYGTSWVQFGIISALPSNAVGYIGAGSIAVYTNLKIFKHWVIDTVTQSGGEVDEAIGSSKIQNQLNCDYNYATNIHGRLYGCWVDGVDIRTDNFEVASFTGSHRDGKTDEDVGLLQFRNGTMFYLPDGIGNNFKNLKHLEIGKSLNTQIIRRSNFKYLKSLIDLRIVQNNIETLEEDSLWDLPHLEIFALVENKLREIDEKTFVNNPKLREIELDGNNLESIPRNLFQKNLLLEKVGLDGNYLKTIDEVTFVNNPELKELYLYENRLESIPRNLFQQNLLLELIQLNENNLKKIDEVTFMKNPKLREIWLYDNHLESIPRNLFQQNLLLEIVWLNGDNLKTIDEVTFVSNPNLKEIYLNDNYIDTIPRNLFEKNFLLEKVWLFKNNLTTIDEVTFVNNPKLREISLYENHIDTIPRNLFQQNLLLELVQLNENNLKKIDDVTFMKNPKLREIWLYDNHLESIPRNLFQQNLLLKIVWLNGNNLKTIDEITFVNNDNLREIYLYDNHLESISRYLFQKNLLLEKIDFQKNSIKIIEIDFTVFKNIKNIYLHDNFCIDGYYEDIEESIEYRNQFRNLTEFQEAINFNCSSVKP